MNRIVGILFGLVPSILLAQPYAPEPGKAGSTAIHKDSSCFVAWANGIDIQRGYIQITDTNMYHEGSNRASFGVANDALGMAEGDGVTVLSLGDSGVVTLRFPVVIQDGPGNDFAVFENGFQDHYMELAHVEVSSDGVHFVRFQSSCQVPLVPQMSNFSTSDCKLVNNLAGKYRSGFGTPFDINELPENQYLNKQQILYVRLIDVIGNTGSGVGTTDTAGNRINDNFPTPFYSSGFDLDGVGVINGVVGIEELQTSLLKVYPNPANETVAIFSNHGTGTVQVMNAFGSLVLELELQNELPIIVNTSNLSSGVYSLIFTSKDEVITQSMVIVHN